jgi:hypothetical protein
MEAALIGSLKVALIVAAVLTFVDPAEGVAALTVGGVVSMGAKAVVNVQL